MARQLKAYTLDFFREYGEFVQYRSAEEGG